MGDSSASGAYPNLIGDDHIAPPARTDANENWLTHTEVTHMLRALDAVRAAGYWPTNVRNIGDDIFTWEVLAADGEGFKRLRVNSDYEGPRIVPTETEPLTE